MRKAKGRALAVADDEGRHGVWLGEQKLTVTSVYFEEKAPQLVAFCGAALNLLRADLDERAE